MREFGGFLFAGGVIIGTVTLIVRSFMGRQETEYFGGSYIIGIVPLAGAIIWCLSGLLLQRRAVSTGTKKPAKKAKG